MRGRYYKKLVELTDTIGNIDKVVPIDFTVDKADQAHARPTRLQPKLNDFYTDVQRCFIEWKHKDYIDNPQVSGRVNLLPPETVFGSWEGVVWFETAPATHGTKDFKIIDYFMDETVVGMYAGDQTETLYLYKMQGNPIPLNLDIEGYIDMLSASLGFVFWQFAVLEILNGEGSPEASTFKKIMPVLKPDFSWDEYCRLYQKNRLKAL